ncbi:hypothetical protein KY290_000587 [Solanum tuberosum]|uniref:Retrovirus-related Pol polyprotein from transposon TNT 1-94-like beta-barrel domain-containing protein n=1 Tax=Solanum tuberosum TaxID=4113 RepID=A0ABQ7WLT7_SOLTU|nr:hypothetical protein KY290_000587 [Solanum tuberosum]
MSQTQKVAEEEEDWGKCFVAETRAVNTMTSINFERDYIVDSECGHHLTGDEVKFFDFHKYNGHDVIVTTYNTVHHIDFEGTIVINKKKEDSIIANSVFHVPKMRKNLFSVENVVDARTYFLFGPHDVKLFQNIKELKEDVIHIGKRVNNLYVLSASNSYIEKMSSNDTAYLWHARLGYLNMENLKMHKSEVLNKLMEFKETVEGELGSRKRRLRTDNGGPIWDEEPSSFKEAKGVKEWKFAMDDEMKALIKKNLTWSLVQQPRDVTNTDKGIFVTQEGYSKKLVDSFGVKQSKMCSTPLETGTRLTHEEGSLLADPKPFRALV